MLLRYHLPSGAQLSGKGRTRRSQIGLLGASDQQPAADREGRGRSMGRGRSKSVREPRQAKRAKERVQVQRAETATVKHTGRKRTRWVRKFGKVLTLPVIP